MVCVCGAVILTHMTDVNYVFGSEGESRQRFLLIFPGKRRSKHILLFRMEFYCKAIAALGNCPTAVNHLPEAAVPTLAQILRVFVP